jgi:hypothetical protein
MVQGHPIGTPDIAQQARQSVRFRGNCLKIDQWLILGFGFFRFDPAVQVDSHLAESAA